jgi:hypothetical protein
MDSVESVCKELEKVLAGLSPAGLGKLDPGVSDKLAALSTAAGAVSMGSGKKLIDNLLDLVNQLKEGKADADRVGIRVTALDFYVKNVLSSGSGAVEDL